MHDTTKTFETIHLARRGVYTFLEQIYLLMPGEKLYDLITDVLPQLSIIAENSSENEMKESVEELKKFFEERELLKGGDLEEFDLEALRKYTSLLCLGSSVPTVESFYTSGSNMLMQESYDEMLKLLRKHNFSRSEAIGEYEDHISIELAFMAKLSEKSAEALAANNNEEHLPLIREQFDMHINHFDKWIPQFAERIFTDQLSQGERIYNACTRFLLGFLKEDKNILKELLGN